MMLTLYLVPEYSVCLLPGPFPRVFDFDDKSFFCIPFVIYVWYGSFYQRLPEGRRDGIQLSSFCMADRSVSSRPSKSFPEASSTLEPFEVCSQRPNLMMRLPLCMTDDARDYKSGRGNGFGRDCICRERRTVNLKFATGNAFDLM